jgi:hypothetical protein
METLLVTAKDKAELQFVADLLKKMHIETKILSEEDREDMGLLKIMKQTDRSQKVSRESIMAKLDQK